MWLNEFKAGDIVCDDFNTCFEIKQIFNNGNVKIKVINLNPMMTFFDIKEFELKINKTYVIVPDCVRDEWIIVESKMSDNSIEIIQSRISNAKKELELAEIELKKTLEKKSVIDVTKNLKINHLYKIFDNDGDIYFGIYIGKEIDCHDEHPFEFLVKYNEDYDGPERISKRWFCKEELNNHPPQLIIPKDTKSMGESIVEFFNSYSVETRE